MSVRTIANKKVSPETLSTICLVLVGLLFIFSGIGKMVIKPPLENIFIAKFLNEITMSNLRYLLPYVEVIIGICLIAIRRKPIAILAIITIAYFIFNNAWLISIGKGFESCGQCLGWGIDTWPIGSIFIDLIMIMLLGVGIYVHRKE